MVLSAFFFFPAHRKVTQDTRLFHTGRRVTLFDGLIFFGALFSAEHGEKLLFVDDLDAEFPRLGQFGAGVLTRDDKGGLL